MTISVVILNYNNWQETLECVKMYKRFSSISSVVVVDNHSTDESISEFINMEASLKYSLVISSKNSGYSSGNNLGIKYAISVLNSDYIIISNPDIIIDNEDSILAMSRILQDNKKIASITTKMVSSTNKPLITFWDHPSMFQDILSTLFLKNKPKASLKGQCEIKYCHNADIISGAFFMIKSEVLKQINYFDENTFLYGEERILGYQIYQIGMNQVVLDTYCHIHNQGTTISKEFTSKLRKYRFLFDSRFYYHKTYRNTNRFLLVIYKISFSIGSAMLIANHTFKKIIKRFS
jgi:GT2 family glycosyltransferase